jgi:putative ABC transport system permease protein
MSHRWLDRMKLQDFRVGWRLLIADPAYSLVAALGLGVGLGICLLLLGYCRYCWQYNAQIPDVDNVYIVKQRNNLELGAPAYDQGPLLLLTAANTAPGVTSVSGYVAWFPLTVEVSGQLRKLKSLTVLPGFAGMVGLQAIKGDLNEALSRPDSFAITEATALRLFGTSDVLGRTLLLRLSAIDENRSPARIAAVLRDPPANTTIPFETLNGPNLSLIPHSMRAELLGGESSWSGNLLIRIRPGTSVATVTGVLQQALDRAPSAQKVSPEMKARLGDRKIADVKLSRLRDAYFDREVAANFTSVQVDRGNSTIVAGLAAIAILILALAAINYVNLAAIRVIRRQREIAMRKVLGAGKGRLAAQFAAESVLVSLLATAVGLLLARLALPVLSELMNRDLGSVLSLQNIGAAVGVGIVLGLLIAIYPAWIAFGVRPSLMLAGRPGTESVQGKRLRQGLSVLQVAAAIGLASVTLAVSLQTRFAIEASPGFDPASLLVFDLPVAVSAQDEKARGLIAELSQQPAIAGITASNDPVGRSKESWSTEIKREGGEAVTLDVKAVSASFFEEYGIRPVAGRLFDSRIDRDDDATPIVIDPIAARQLGFASPELAVGQALQFRPSREAPQRTPVLVVKRIIGIAPEVRFQSLREAPAAVAYELLAYARYSGTLTVRASGSIADAERAVHAVWSRYYPNSVVEMTPAKEIWAANYADDARLARLLAFATAIALVIAAFGVYVLAADAVQRRTREIALRRLFGTRRRDIGKLVAKDVGAVILLSAVIALPLAALAIGRYLAAYTEQAPYAFWSPAFAVATVLVTAAIAAARQAWAAMMLKPAVALRS